MPDAIPREHEFRFEGPDDTGQCVALFYAFNTVITLQAFGDQRICAKAFESARDACRRFERLFSRTLPHSDITRINQAHGAWVDVSRETFDLIEASIGYCAESGGIFDITMGSAVRLWDFHAGTIPDRDELRKALEHVDWQSIDLSAANEAGTYAPRIRLNDPCASIDVGGTAKGYIADRLGEVLLRNGIESFIVNLGGNVLAHGTKPNGSPWMIGLQDPRASRESGTILGAVPLCNASAVTSGTYERAFKRGGTTYHHILDTKTGFPVETDIAGATVIAERSIDAEGYSTTLLALGTNDAAAFVHAHPAIAIAYLADDQGNVMAVANEAAGGTGTGNGNG
ncbi:MAG: FAD:protein FMN transferase [Slackia sp.]|nr:FAD:protein FMN transferase [Slackia sp.]